MFLYHRFNTIVCNRLHNGHICPTHSYLIDCEDHPEYTDCKQVTYWWGFTSSDDRQRLSSVVAFARDFVNIITKLLTNWLTRLTINCVCDIWYNKQHVLNSLVPRTSETKYHLSPRHHNLTLSVKVSTITECDFVMRLPFKDVY